MASSSKIKGITIEIGGNTTKLENALKDVNKVVYSTNTELKELNKALKLDPKNTELLAQKQEVLKNNIEATTKRLNTLKTAQQQMGSYAKLTDEQKEKYRALSIEIAKSESALRGMKEELKATSSINLNGLVTGLKNVGVVASQVLTTVTKVASTVGAALGAIVTAGVKSYAELEQNLGGVETLFGDAADIVKKNAAEAYKTAGVSANEYMQGVTSFSASLLQSLSGDTQKAAEVADMAFRDMSDNANKFGTSTSSLRVAQLVQIRMAVLSFPMGAMWENAYNCSNFLRSVLGTMGNCWLVGESHKKSNPAFWHPVRIRPAILLACAANSKYKSSVNNVKNWMPKIRPLASNAPCCFIK